MIAGLGDITEYWTGPDAARLVFVPVDPLTTCFDRASGQTHLLADPLPQLLDLLTGTRLSTDGCVVGLMARFDMDQSVAEVTVRVTECLKELARMGLVAAA